MPTLQQRKLQKRKARDEKNKNARLFRERLAAEKRQELAADFRKLKRIKKLKKEMGQMNVWADDVFMRMSENTISQLEHNAQILKALEEEYEKEWAKKKALNQDLEDKGLTSLKDKMQYLHDQLIEDQKIAGAAVIDEENKLAEKEGRASVFAEKIGGFGPSTSETRIANKPKKEVAEVSVIRAPNADVTEKEISS